LKKNKEGTSTSRFQIEFFRGVPVEIAFLGKQVAAGRRLLRKVQFSGGPVSLLGIFVLRYLLLACLDELAGLGCLGMLFG
jgi:hypothetical protein